MRFSTYKEDIRRRFKGEGPENILKRISLIMISNAAKLDSIDELLDDLFGKHGQIAERLDHIEEFMREMQEEPEPLPEIRFWKVNTSPELYLAALRQKLIDFGDTSEENHFFAYGPQAINCKTAARAFSAFLVAAYVDIWPVNLMSRRHCYEERDLMRHADTFVVMRNLDNPSLDIVVDFVHGVSEPGILLDRLQFLWHEGPYDWWTDNAFTEGCP